jgi:anti-anti-sigma factor
MSENTHVPSVFRIEGELTIYTAASVKQQMDGLLDQSPQLEIDLSQVSEMDTAGLQLLILAKKESASRGGELRLVGHSVPVLEVLDMCHMANYFGDPVVISMKSN